MVGYAVSHSEEKKKEKKTFFFARVEKKKDMLATQQDKGFYKTLATKKN